MRIRNIRRLAILPVVAAMFAGVISTAPAAKADTSELFTNTKGYYAGGNLHWIGNMVLTVYYSQRVSGTIQQTRPCCYNSPIVAGDVYVYGNGYDGNNIPAGVRWVIKDIRYYNADTGDLWAVSTPQTQLNGCQDTNKVDPHGNSPDPWGRQFTISNVNGHGTIAEIHSQSNCWSTSDTAAGGYYGWHRWDTTPSSEHGVLAASFLCYNLAGQPGEPNCANYPNTPVGTIQTSLWYQ